MFGTRDDCIYKKGWGGSRYEPSESWCNFGYDVVHDCEKCPFYYSKEDYEADKADFEYDRYKDSF
jgi:hypothetical protein